RRSGSASQCIRVWSATRSARRSGHRTCANLARLGRCMPNLSSNSLMSSRTA
ncbi:hypothetical protein H4S02_009642, partial [Coemansia sp. RSA 2611]